MKRCLLFLCMLLGIASTATAQVQPTDTDGDGYVNISTLDHLRWISENSSSWVKNFELDNNINAAATANWNSKAGFSPIGDSTTAFTGKINGNGFAIDSLFINRPDVKRIGLFGRAKKAEISNIGITNCQYIGYANIGGLIGVLDSSSVLNCHCTGRINAVYTVGGLVGDISNSIVNKCFSSVTVTGNKNVGGLLGANEKASTVSDCYYTGTVTGNENAGGLIGSNEGNFSVVSNCYSIGNVSGNYNIGGLVGVNSNNATVNQSYSRSTVTGNDNVGGLVGNNYSASTVSNSYSMGKTSGDSYIGGLIGQNYAATVNACYSTGNVIGQKEFIGGLVGRIMESVVSDCYSMGNVAGKDSVGGLIGDISDFSNLNRCYSTGTVSGIDGVGGLVGTIDNYSTENSCFWDIQTSGMTTSSVGTGKTTAEMKTMSTFTSSGWNFNLIWDIESATNNGYPYLHVRGLTYSGIEPIDTDGDGYRNISCYSHLHWISLNSSSWAWNFELDNNINADTTRLLAGDIGFTPIGNRQNLSSGTYFTGKFNGNGFAIDRLYINRPNTSSIGLFGCTSKAEILNLGITNSRIIGRDWVGGLVGWNVSSMVTNCYSSGYVSGKSTVGGLVGWNDSSQVSASYSEVNVTGSGTVGGLMGRSSNSTARECYSKGSVSGEGCLGGLIAGNATSNVINCYSRSNVSGQDNVGGLIGINHSNSLIYNSYSTGKVSGNNLIGGFISENSESIISNCFWDTQTSGIDTSAGGKGKSTADMNTMSTFTSATWNFNMIWSINASVNNGYPYINERGITFAGIEPIDTDGDGYKNISCYSHLHWISQNASSWSWNLELDNNINADSTRLLNGDIGFNPIGNDKIDFTGKFDGHGFTIDGLYINKPYIDAIGLFGRTNGAEISKVGITNCRVIGRDNVGALVGVNDSSKVIKCYSTGSANAVNAVGGLVGWNSYSLVDNSYSEVNVSGNITAGGLLGRNSNSTASKCYSNGSVTGEICIGGLIAYSASSNVNNCYSRSNVSGQESVGGMIGINYTNSNVYNSYSTGKVIGNNYVGGFIADSRVTTISNCFWDTQTSGIDTSAGGTGKTTVDMTTKSTFTSAGWDFNLVWDINTNLNSGYPIINERGIAFSGIEPIDTDGDGYRNISCYSHLHWISLHDSSWVWNFELDNNINADSTSLLFGDIGFNPIGNGDKNFTGKFEGHGFSIDNLYINSPGNDNIGLLGKTSGAKISNIGITNCRVIGRFNVGGLVGHNYEKSTVNNCYSTGSVSGQSSIGGLLGYHDRASSVSNCYSTSNVTGITNVGGLVGLNSSSMLSNCYSTGNSSGGGLLGGNDESSMVTNCFWDKETSGKDFSYAGACKTTAEMKTKSTFTDAGWNFYSVWSINSSINNGYPYINDRMLTDFSGIEPIDTDGDGYRNISCYSHLHWISRHTSSWAWNFEMDNNINADTTWLISWDIGFAPIGNEATCFSGKFEGNGFAIDSLYINKLTTNFIGLFGRTQKAEISNVGITNCRVFGSNFTGGLVGKIDSLTTMTNCYSTGSVSGSNCVGGLVGRNDISSTIINSYSTNSVLGIDYVGGLVGVNNEATMSNSYSTGSVSGNNYVGGLVGKNDTSSTIINSYSKGSVSGNNYVGGLVGRNNNSKVNKCYSTGSVSGNNYVGGLIGSNDSVLTVSNSFWDIRTSETTKSAGGIGIRTIDMYTKSTFTNAGWNFDLIWSIDATVNDGYPYINLRGFSFAGIEPVDIDGDGYRNISCYSHLHWIGLNASSWAWNFELDDNINADSTRLLIDDMGFNPIGNSGTSFSGKFKGNGFTINGLYINRPAANNIGLFGSINCAEISNLGITNCQIIGHSYVGGIVGLNDSSTVTNSYSTGKSYITGNITGDEYVGGLVGRSASSTVSNSYSKCNILGTKYVGGLVGENASSSTVNTSYSTGLVFASSYRGGLVGNNNSGTVNNSFWDTQSSCIDTSDGGTGKTTYEMKIKLTFTNAGWNFDSTWAIAADYNDGYPNLDGKNGPDGIKEIYSNSLIYPQPASNELFVRLSETSNESAKIKLYDQSGLLALAIETNANDGVIRLNTSALASGVYHVLINIDGKNYSAKVVVAK